MRRRWLRVALAVLVLALVVAAGAAAVALSTAPAFIAGAMSQVLGRHVSIGSIGIHAGLRMRVDLTDLRIHTTPDPGSPLQLEAPHAEGSQAWPRVLVGQLVPLSWVVDSPTLRLRLGPGGPAESFDLRALDLTVHDGRVELVTPRGDYTVSGLELEASSGVLLPTLEGSARGQLRTGEHALGRFEATFSGGFDRKRLRGRVRDLDLARIGLPSSLAASGSASGEFSADLGPKEYGGTLDLAFEKLGVRVPGLDTAIAPRSARLAVSGRWRAGELELTLDPLEVDDLVLRGPLNVTTAGDGRVKLSFGLGPFAPGVPSQGRINALSLLGRRFATLGHIHDSLEAGQVEGDLEVDLPLAGMASLLSFAKPLRPEQFGVHLRVSGGTYRHGHDSDPFTNISGHVDIDGDRFAMTQVQMTRGGSPLPLLDITIDGFARLIGLPAEERYLPAGPGVATPGLGPAFTSLLPGPHPSDAPRPASPVVRLRELHLEHPALLFPIRNATAELHFPEGRLVADPIRGVIAGGAADMRIEWDRAKSHVIASVRYDYAAAGSEPPPPKVPRDEWLSGRLGIEQLQLGSWPLASVAGSLRARGADLDLYELSGLTSGGVLGASADISLNHEGSAPIELQLDLRDTDVNEVSGVLGLGKERITGRGDVRGKIHGTLDPHQPFLGNAKLELEVELRDGTLRELPVALEIARLPSLQGVLGLFGRAMPYSSVTGSLTIDHGVLRTERLALLGPELRLLAAGEIGLREPQQPTDMVVAVLLVQTLDRMIEKVPVLGSWVLGKDESLLAVYVQVQGPWADPRVSLLPPGSLQAAAGWAGRMIGRGMRGLRDWVIPHGSSQEAEKSEHKSKSEAGPRSGGEPGGKPGDKGEEPTAAPDPGAAPPDSSGPGGEW